MTHDQVEALTLADRIAVLRQGRIVQIGTPQDIYDRPATIFVAQLVGAPRINLLPTAHADNVLRVEESEIQIDATDPAKHFPPVFTLGIRPEDVQPRVEGRYSGEVSLVEPLGVETIVHIRSGSQTLLSIVSGMAQWRIGDTIRFDIKREHLHFFAPDGARI